MKQQGPKEITIPEQKFFSCYGCEFHKHNLVRSGREPIYADNCMHPEFRKGRAINPMSGNLHKNFDGHLVTPSDCPFVKKNDTAGTPGHGTSGNFQATQSQYNGGYSE